MDRINGEKTNRLLASLVYLLPIVGPLLILFFSRKSLFLLYHACQALALAVAVVLIPVAWAMIGWAIVWIPLAGPVLAASLFALVVAGYIAAVIAWVVGILNALQGKYRGVPIFGEWGERSFLYLAAGEQPLPPQESREIVI